MREPNSYPNTAASNVIVRPALDQDAEAIAHLVLDMGYSVAAETIRQRMIALPDNHALFVAAIGPEVCGWVHLVHSHSLISGPRVEIGGLAVAERHQRRGIGGILLQQAELWTLKRGVDLVYLRSGTERQAAHDFYRKHGYQQLKSQLAISKVLPDRS
jgi:GNAT superfamily N-acetyltransferase